MMVLWMPLSLTLMVICLSDRSGLMNGGWILTWGFLLGSKMYLQKNWQQVWKKSSHTTTPIYNFLYIPAVRVSITLVMFNNIVSTASLEETTMLSLQLINKAEPEENAILHHFTCIYHSCTSFVFAIISQQRNICCKLNSLTARKVFLF